MRHSKISFPDCRKIRFWETYVLKISRGRTPPRPPQRFGPSALNFFRVLAYSRGSALLLQKLMKTLQNNDLIFLNDLNAWQTRKDKKNDNIHKYIHELIPNPIQKKYSSTILGWRSLSSFNNFFFFSFFKIIIIIIIIIIIAILLWLLSLIIISKIINIIIISA